MKNFQPSASEIFRGYLAGSSNEHPPKRTNELITSILISSGASWLLPSDYRGTILILVFFASMNALFLQVFKILFDDFQIQFAEGGQNFKTRRFGKNSFQLFHFLFVVRHVVAISFQD